MLGVNLRVAFVWFYGISTLVKVLSHKEFPLPESSDMLPITRMDSEEPMPPIRHRHRMRHHSFHVQDPVQPQALAGQVVLSKEAIPAIAAAISEAASSMSPRERSQALRNLPMVLMREASVNQDGGAVSFSFSVPVNPTATSLGSAMAGGPVPMPTVVMNAPPSVVVHNVPAVVFPVSKTEVPPIQPSVLPTMPPIPTTVVIKATSSSSASSSSTSTSSQPTSALIPVAATSLTTTSTLAPPTLINANQSATVTYSTTTSIASSTPSTSLAANKAGSPAAMVMLGGVIPAMTSAVPPGSIIVPQGSTPSPSASGIAAFVPTPFANSPTDGSSTGGFSFLPAMTPGTESGHDRRMNSPIAPNDGVKPFVSTSILFFSTLFTFIVL